MMRLRCKLLLAGVLAGLLIGHAVWAAAAPLYPVYLESFDSHSNDRTIATLSAYPSLSGQFVVDGSAVVTDGRLVLVNGTNDNNQLFIQPGVAGATTVSTRVGANNSSGNYNVGLLIGQNRVVFHPGYGGAALRVDGPGGFGNTNVGFTPANNVLHDLEVTSDGAGLFSIRLTDGANPANVWTGSWTNAGSVGGPVGMVRSGQPVGVGLFDDFAVGGSTQAFNVDTDAGTSGVFLPQLADGTVAVSGGRITLASGGGNNSQVFLRSGLKRDHTMVAKVGASNSNGNYNVGLVVGQNNVVFHPGYAGAALRVDGPGGFGNTNVGFTPANGVAHELRVKSDGTGNYQVTLIDGSNPANRFTTSFFNPGSIGGNFGLRRSGGATGTGFFDDLWVEIEGRYPIKSELFDRNDDTALKYLGNAFQPSTGREFVSGGRLVMAAPPAGADMYLYDGFLTGPTTISTLVGSDLCNGNFNVGLVVGENQVVFHPGLGGGAFRVEGPNGFGNTDVGFTPANGVLHKLEVTSDGSGLFNIRFTDGSNPANVWTGSWTNPGSLGGRVGLVRKGPTDGLGLFDDFTVGSLVEPFATNTDAPALYPDWTATLNGGQAVVNNGTLILSAMRGANNAQTFLTAGASGEFELTALVGADASNGSYNVGLVVGQNNIVFHPGLAGGALRVDGPGGFGNTDVGFTPANGVLHRLLVESDGLGQFDFTLIDGANPANTFSASFFNPGSLGGRLGFIRSGPDVGVGLFDEFIVTGAVPEPASWALALLGLAGLLIWRCRRGATPNH